MNKQTTLIKLSSISGDFAENKDAARHIRDKQILPALKDGCEVVIDFSDISCATQGFVHALISEAIRQYGDDVFDKLVFKNCSDTIKEIVNIVADYMQES